MVNIKNTSLGMGWIKMHDTSPVLLDKMKRLCAGNAKDNDDALVLLQALGLIPYREDSNATA